MNFNPKIVTDGLVLCLNAADKKSYAGSGDTWYDRSGNDYDGTLENDPTFSTAVGGCLDFDGVDDKVEVGSLGTSGEFSECSISIWFNKDTQEMTYGNLFDCNYGVVDLNKGPRMEVGSDESYIRLYLAGDGGSYRSVTAITSAVSDVWYHITWVITTNAGVDQSVTPYVNGVKGSIHTTSDTAKIWDGDMAALYLGVGFTTGRYFTGRIAAFQIYDKVLSDAEVIQNFNTMRGRFGV